MQLTINRKGLLDSLGSVCQIAGKNITLPVLACAKFTTRTDGILTLAAFDMEVSITKKLKVAESFDSEFSFCVNPNDLKNIVNTLRCDTVTMDVTESECIIRHETGEVSLPVMPAKDFPSIDMEKDTEKIVLPAALLFDWLKKALRFVGADKIRPLLSGIHIYSDGKEVGVASTDSQYLYNDYVPSAVTETDKVFSATISSKAVVNTLSLINGEEKICLYLGENQIAFRTSDALLTAQKFVGKFPNFKSVLMGRKETLSIEVDKEGLVDSVSRALLTANIVTGILRLTIADNAIQIDSEDVGLNKKAREHCPCRTDGDALTIGLKGGHLLTCINAIDADSIEMTFQGNNNSVLFKDNKHGNKSIILMPMRVAN